jgi:hypothetical protein
MMSVALNLGEKAYGTHRLGGWLNPRAGMDMLEKREISCPLPEIKHSFCH